VLPDILDVSNQVGAAFLHQIEVLLAKMLGGTSRSMEKPENMRNAGMQLEMAKHRERIVV